MRLRLTPLLALASVLLACGSDPPSKASPDAGPSFIATQGDFAGFTSWEAFDGGLDADDSLDGGLRTIYLNKRPPHGSTSFTLGTIIVKTTQGTSTFAMAKRGADFNPLVNNWEWFQIQSNPDGSVQILWRGLGPTSTMGYGSVQATGCTGCHFEASFDNDSVAGTALLLSSF